MVDFEEPNPVDLEPGPNPFDRSRRAATAPFILFFTSVTFAIIFKFNFSCLWMYADSTKMNMLGFAYL